MSSEGGSAEDRPVEELDLVLRPAASDEADAVADLFLAARAAAVPDMPPPVHTAEEIREWFRAVTGSTHEVWLAERADAIVGYAMLSGSWLHSLYIRPDLTGHGVGSVLLDMVKGLRPQGFGLWVFETNVRAQAFYLRHGLVEVARTAGADNEERAPDVHLEWAGTLDALRNRIDRIDDDLARLLDERAGVTAEIQRRKPVSGHAGRDPGREAEIVARMAEQAPNLGRDGMSRIMHAVITASLDAADD